jgi:threonine/homoserine/homoserine lactone efflux protein
VTHLVAFLGVSLLVIVTPGQDTALTIRNTLLAGRRGGLRTAAGVAAGQATWTLAASAGVVALLRASEPAFVAVRLLGAAYLVYLGLQTLLRRGEVRLGAGGSPRRSFRQGLLSNLGNPKMAVFFTSLLPQFGSSFSALVALGLAFCSLTFLWLSGYAWAVARAGDVLRRPGIRRALDRVTGAVLVAFGLRLAAESR